MHDQNSWSILYFEQTAGQGEWYDGQKWMFAVYWGMCVTLGIGVSIVPATPVEVVYSFLCSGVGIFMFSFIIGAASEALSELDSIGHAGRQREQALQRFMHSRGVVRERLRTYSEP